MLDPLVRVLVEQTISSPIKLQLLLFFSEHAYTEGSAAQIAQRLYRDIWSTREALNDLVADGVFTAAASRGEQIYYYRPRPDYLEPITRLLNCYNEPLERDSVQGLVREVASYTDLKQAVQRAGLEYT